MTIFRQPPGTASELTYQAPIWMPGGHMQTIWPALFSEAGVAKGMLQFERQRLTAPDGDFVDADWLRASDSAVEQAKRPLLLLFHGLEGSSQSHYARAFARYAHNRNWDYVVPHFRGCSGEINRAPRAYHSGDYEEIAWLLAQLTQGRTGPVYAAGVSLGGNALLRWSQEAGETAARKVSAVAAISAPLDLALCGAQIDTGINRQIYVRNFLSTMKPRARQKHAQYPGLFDLQAVLRAQSLYEFDNAFTAPLHGFRNTEDYWRRASSVHAMHSIRIPALVINALNDPFVPPTALPRHEKVPSHVQLFQPRTGGHVGFAGGRIPGHVHALPQMVGQWLAANQSAGACHG